jgi:hypothetical protein
MCSNYVPNGLALSVRTSHCWNLLLRTYKVFFAHNSRAWKTLTIRRQISVFAWRGSTSSERRVRLHLQRFKTTKVWVFPLYICAREGMWKIHVKQYGVAYINPYKHACMHARTHEHRHTYTRACVRACVHTRTRARTHTPLHYSWVSRKQVLTLAVHADLEWCQVIRSTNKTLFCSLRCLPK